MDNGLSLLNISKIVKSYRESLFIPNADRLDEKALNPIPTYITPEA